MYSIVGHVKTDAKCNFFLVNCTTSSKGKGNFNVETEKKKESSIKLGKFILCKLAHSSNILRFKLYSLFEQTISLERYLCIK